MIRKKALFAAAGIATGAVSGAWAQDEEFPRESDTIVVTASPIQRTAGETILNSTVISGDELERRLENSIGETLRREPGVSSTFFGPGASRPVIRGLGGDRIRVLDNGIGAIDASATSPDHAVAVAPAAAETVEIVRGSGTLLYGSSAAGGVVNVLSGRIPRKTPKNDVGGALRAGWTTVDKGVEAAGGFDAKLADFGAGALVFHGDGFYRDAEDYDIPGFAESEILRAMEEAQGGGGAEEEVFGTVENAAFESKGGAAGASFIFGNGFFGLSGAATKTRYGVPGAHHEEGEEEGGVMIDLDQVRIDAAGEADADLGLFHKAKLRFGYADYEHAEIEPSGETGTVFSNQGFEGRLELLVKTYEALGGKVDGAAGVQFLKRDFSATGAEAFVPPTDTSQFGFFALQEFKTGAWRLELGGRYERARHAFQDMTLERSFDAFSVSGGAGYSVNDHVFIGVTGFRTERAPSTEELFSNGPHLATNAFEIGDPALGEEVARGAEATMRYNAARFSAAVSGYYTSYKDFIFEAATGEEEDGLPVFQFFAEDAAFRGFEAQIEAELLRFGGVDIHGDASLDYVRATRAGAGNNNLPRIPPVSGLVGLEARSEFVDLRAELEFAAKQNKTADFERPTEGYRMLNAFVTLRPFRSENGDLSLRLAMNNLTNEDARVHASFLKDLAPLAGRNFRISLKGAF